MSGQLRWLRGRDGKKWHLSWDGITTVCGHVEGGGGRLTRLLEDGPPTDLPIHPECQRRVASAVGFWEGSS
jgi:hypothetical protein